MINYNPSVTWIFPKSSTCPSGMLRTKLTNPVAKSTSPGLSDTTFFARWDIYQMKSSKQSGPLMFNSRHIRMQIAIQPFYFSDQWRIKLIEISNLFIVILCFFHHIFISILDTFHWRKYTSFFLVTFRTALCLISSKWWCCISTSPIIYNLQWPTLL